MLQIGELIKIKEIQNKRIWGRVTTSNISETAFTLTLEGVYKPSPKSRLRGNPLIKKVNYKLIK